jgi:hypothetical protein
MIEAAAAIAAIFGAVGAVTAVLRDWDTGPKLVLASVAIVGVVVLGAAVLGLAARGPSADGEEGRSPPPANSGVPTIEPDPSHSEEYLDCSRNAGYDPAACEVLRDEETGDAARRFYRDCRDSGYDTQYCLDGWNGT